MRSRGKNAERPELRKCLEFARPLDTTTPGARLVCHVFAALGEFIREMIVQGTRVGAAPVELPAAADASCTAGELPAMPVPGCNRPTR